MFFYFYCLLYPKVATGTKPTINTTNLQEKKKDGGCKQRHRHKRKETVGWREAEKKKTGGSSRATNPNSTNCASSLRCTHASLHPALSPSLVVADHGVR